jgi:hypothetical protein
MGESLSLRDVDKLFNGFIISISPVNGCSNTRDSKIVDEGEDISKLYHCGRCARYWNGIEKKYIVDERPVLVSRRFLNSTRRLCPM